MIKQEIIKTIESYETILIHRHVRPDPDAYGSQIGLKHLLKSTFPNKYIYVVGETEDSLSFLGMMDEVADDTYKDALVIVCDTANTDRICDQRYKLGEKLIKIDHHPNRDAYGDIDWIDTDSSSTSEMIYELINNVEAHKWVMSDKVARLIYAGIVGDTGRFLFPSTTKRTFEIASELVAYNFDRSSLYENLYETNHRLARLKGYILEHFTLSDLGVSTTKLSLETMQKFDVDTTESGGLISVLADIKGIKVWALFIEEGPDLIRVRLRSKGPVINDIAEKYNGGGHPLASGATVSTWKEADELAKDLERRCQSEVNGLD